MANLNMLLLGETGAGKTTFINALINYIAYATFETAQSTGIIIAAPMVVSVINQYKKLESFRVEPNIDKTYKGGTTNAKFKEYHVPYGDHQLCLLDLPAIDHLSEDFVKQLKHLKEIHCFCFFLKSSLFRLNSSFEYCIRQIISELDVSIVKNFIFVFTNGRSARFDPGVAKDVLKGFIESIQKKPPYVKIPLEPTNIFCVENEAIINLMSLRFGIELNREIIDRSINSWNFSVDECTRLLSHIQELKPYKFKPVVIKPVSPVTKLENFFNENIDNIFAIFDSNYKSLQQCRNLKDDSVTALNIVGNIEQQLKYKLNFQAEMSKESPVSSTYSETIKQVGPQTAGQSKIYSATYSDNNSTKYSSNNAIGHSDQTQKDPYTDGTQVNDTVSQHSKNKLQYNVFKDHVEQGTQKMNIGDDDEDNNMKSLVLILQKQRDIIKNLHDSAEQQKAEISELIKNVAQFATCLNGNATYEVRFLQQILQFSGESFEHLKQEYQNAKSIIHGESREDLTEEDVEAAIKKLEKLQHYQEFINQILGS